MEQTRTPKKICGRIGLGLLGMMAVWLAANIGGQYLLARYAPRLLAGGWALFAVNDATLYLLGVPVFLAVLHFVPDGPAAPPREKIPFGFGKYVLCMLFCFGATWLLNFVAGILILLLQMASGGAGGIGGVQALAGESPVWARVVFGVLVPATGEEFLFRYMLRRKLRGAGDKIYIFFSALCFGAFHGNIAQGMYAFVVGAVFAWVYVATNRLWVPVTMHFFLNMVGMVAGPLATENAAILLVFSLFVLLLIPTAIVFFFVFRRRVFATMAPPHEAGWPYRPPQPRLPRGWTPYYYAPAPPAQAFPYGAAWPAAPTAPVGASAGTAWAPPDERNAAPQGEMPLTGWAAAAPGAAYAGAAAPAGASAGTAWAPPDERNAAPQGEMPLTGWAQAAPGAAPVGAGGYPAYPAPPGAPAPYASPYPPGPAQVYPAYSYPAYPYPSQAGYPAYPYPGGVSPAYPWQGGVPAAGYFAYPYPAVPVQARAPRGPGAAGVCLGNAGMILFLCLAGVVTVLTLLTLLV